jgi:hypothetical protein
MYQKSAAAERATRVLPSDALSLSDLSANSIVTCEDGFVPIRSYFDGANQAQRQEYSSITLCAVAGNAPQWTNLEHRWGNLMERLDAPYIHTTDMLTLNEPFKG